MPDNERNHEPARRLRLARFTVLLGRPVPPLKLRMLQRTPARRSISYESLLPKMRKAQHRKSREFHLTIDAFDKVSTLSVP